MTTATPPLAPHPERHVDAPHRHGHRLHCPRCEARLMFDGDDYVCVACGYTFPEDELSGDVRRDLDRAGRSRHVMMGLATGATIGVVLGRSLGAIAWLGLVAGAAVTVAAAVGAWSGRRARAS